MLLLLLLSLLSPARALADFTVPRLTGPVVDDAGILSSDARATLDGSLHRLWEQGGSQIAVLTVPDLGGLTIEEASIKVTDAWKLGTAKKDNGVLLMIAWKEHGLRIEVGQGLEGQLTDAYSRRIIDDVIVPHFKHGDPSGGVLAGVAAIARYTDPNVDLGLGRGPANTRYYDDQSDGMPLSTVFWVIIVIVMVLFSLFRRRRYRSYGFWGGWGGGGGGGWGGGGGGGGFSGGGGGFSGGGSSGSW